MQTNATTKSSHRIATSPAKRIGHPQAGHVEVFTPTRTDRPGAMAGDVAQYFVDVEVDATTRCILRAKLRGAPGRG